MPAIKRRVGKKGMFNLFLGIAVAGMALGGVIPGFVLAWVGFNADLQTQTPLAEQGILWLVTVIPALLMILAVFIISKYDLSDEMLDRINLEIEARNAAD